MSTIAIIAAGGMGAALGERLTSNGVRVITALGGRSAASRQRAEAAGMIDVGEAELLEADLILSVVPPDQALPLARALSPVLASAQHKPVYVDCNAVSPKALSAIEQVIAASGAPFVDGGIIGLPPKPGNAGPTIYVSGPHAEALTLLRGFGISVAVLDAPNGAASALKMSYAGITKGLIALAATMALASQRACVAAALKAELQKSQPHLLASFAKSVPDMIPKARRWVPEMYEIAEFVGDLPSAEAYKSFAALYKSLAEATTESSGLREFYDVEKSSP